MATFPSLSSGAVMQYPAAFTSGQKAQVIRFLDGADQRYLTQTRALRKWQIRLNLLTEAEIAQLEQFFFQQKGDYGAFDFPDPFTGVAVSNCRFAASEFVSEYTGVDESSATIWVIETNG